VRLTHRLTSGHTLLGACLVVVVGGDRFQVFGFKYLVAIQAADILHAIASRQDFGPSMLTGLHKCHSKDANSLVKPLDGAGTF
jgi:hypothetical protein